MAVRAARTRTESMAQRLAKQPISEGFELWDKGYILGAMRLFIFKAENSPPFLLGPCLDAVAHLLLQIEEFADAKENFGFAVEKYELIKQPIHADLMRAKVVECENGPEAAIAAVTELIDKYDPQGRASETTDQTTRTALARLYHTRSEMLYKCGDILPNTAPRGITDATTALTLHWERAHLSQYLLAKHLQSLNDHSAAIAAFEATIAMNPNYLSAYAALALALKGSDGERALQFLERAIAIHPRSSLIREKVFLMSERGNDRGALALLTSLLLSPPLEEADPLDATSSTVAVLLKAKAAILADAGEVVEALEAAEAALREAPLDEEAAQIVSDLRGAVV